jgi:HK97 family phage major capsid protein
MALGVTTSGSATAEGTHLTVEQVQKILVQPLQARSVFLSSGVHPFDTNGSPIRIPKQAPPDDADVSFVGENTAIPENDFAFDHVSLLPSTMKSIKVITRFSNELARQSVVSLDAAIQQRLVTDVATKLDKALISSIVTDGTVPTGLLSYTGIQTLAVAGAATVDMLYDAEELALSAEVDAANLRWMMNAKLYKNLKKLKATGTGNYLIQPDPTGRAANALLGYPITVTSRIPRYTAGSNTINPAGTATKAVLWDPTQVAVARDLTPAVTLLKERYADFDQLALRVVSRYDAGPLNAAAIVSVNDITGIS